MKCINESIGHLISLYEFGQLSEEQKALFEAHLLECNFCFRNLHELSPAIEEMQEDPDFFLPAVKEAKKQTALEIFRNWLPKPALSGLEIIKRPAWGFGALGGLVFAVLVFILLLPPDQLSDLARIEPVPYIPTQTRGGGDTEQVFEDGMEFYVKEEYARAAEKLTLAVAKEPDNVSFRFYLGLSYLLALKIDQAIQHFEKVIELGGNSLLEKAHWYLAQAYLLKENEDRALQEFEKVVEMEGDYEWEAREMMEEIIARLK